MRLIRDNPGKQILQSSVVTIGNFDGLHLGHQALIQRCKELADISPTGSRRPIAMVTFEPLPGAWFRPETAPARLMSIRQKLAWLQNEGVDLVWVMRFNRDLAGMAADSFVQNILVDVLDAADVVVGDDFHYGKARQGNANTLAEAGTQHGFALSTIASVNVDTAVDAERASSSSIRKYLADGEFLRASQLLGRPYRTEGKVIHGRKLGRKLGYPTANIKPRVLPSPIEGVFAVRARWDERGWDESGRDKSGSGKSGWHDGVASLGTRPAVGGQGFLIEVHLFDFDADLYGRRMEVEYIKKLRNEEHFQDIDDLVRQMREDERLARECLRQTTQKQR